MLGDPVHTPTLLDGMVCTVHGGGTESFKVNVGPQRL